MCFQGSHDCPAIQSKVDTLQQNNIALLSGSVWLCHECLNKANPVAPRKSKSRHNSISSTLTASATNSRAQSPTPPLTEEQRSVIEHQHERDEVEEHQAPVCEKYKIGKCPHGMRGNKIIDDAKCPKSHPKRCLRFCRNGKSGKYGCKRGDSCKFYHPVLCKYSVQRHICTNKSCTFVHLKGTKRSQSQAPQGENNTSANARAVSQQGRSRTLSQRSQTNHGPSGNNTADPDVNSGHFLELKNVVQLMNNNLQQQQQELSFLRSNLMQFRQFQMQPHPPHLPSPLSNPMHLIHQNPSVQTPLAQSMMPPTITFIPPSSC